MASTNLDILVRVLGGGDLKKLEGDLKSTGTTANTSSGHFSKFGSALGSVAKTAGIAAGAAGLGALTVGLKIGIGEWTQSTKVAAQTAAVLKSTGGAAGVTAAQVDKLATSIMKKSGMDDEAVKSGENLLLTFTNIKNQAGAGNDIFTQTTSIMADMSVALGEDTGSAAIQLGKALNDPIKGVTALQRVGVSFTKDQREQIKALVDSGQTMKAQKLILGELNKEFGGSAEAMGKTLPGQINILKERFNNFAGDLVARSIPVIQQMIGWLKDHWPEIQAALQSFWNSAKPILDALGKLLAAAWPIAQKAIETFLPVLQDVAKVVGDVVKLVAALLSGDWATAWDMAKTVVMDVLNLIADSITASVTLFWNAFSSVFTSIFITPFQNLWNTVSDWVKNNWVNILVVAITGLPGLLWTAIQQGWIPDFVTPVLDAFKTAANTVIGGFKTALDTAWNAATGVAGWLKGLGAKVTAAVTGAATWLKQHGTDAINAFKAAMVTAWDAVSNWLSSTGGRVTNAVTGAAGWLKDIGSQAINGLWTGMKEAWKSIVNWLKGIGDDIVNAIKKPVNAVIGGVNALHIPVHFKIPGIPKVEVAGITLFPGWGGYDKSFDIDPIPDIPKLAMGGIVTRPTLALIGERGPEAVIPLNRAGTTINIHVAGSVVTENDLVEAIYQGLHAKGRRNPLALPA